MSYLTLKKLTLGVVFLIILVLIYPSIALATEVVTIPNPLQCDNLFCVLFGVMRLFLGILALFGTFMFMYGGFLMLTSGGNPEIIKKAKDTLVWSSIGIAVVLLSWAITNFIMKIIVKTSF